MHLEGGWTAAVDIPVREREGGNTKVKVRIVHVALIQEDSPL